MVDDGYQLLYIMLPKSPILRPYPQYAGHLRKSLFISTRKAYGNFQAPKREISARNGIKRPSGDLDSTRHASISTQWTFDKTKQVEKMMCASCKSGDADAKEGAHKVLRRP